MLEDLYRACLRGNIEFQRPYRILDLAALEIASGNLSTATKLVDEGVESAIDAGNNQAAAWLAYPVGVLNAHLGESHRAREAAATLARRGTEQDGRTRLVMAGHVLGLLALADGEPASRNGRARGCARDGRRHRRRAAVSRSGPTRRDRGGGPRRRYRLMFATSRPSSTDRRPLSASLGSTPPPLPRRWAERDVRGARRSR